MKQKWIFFLAFSSFFCDQIDVGNLISDSSAFSKSSLNIWKLSVHAQLKPGLENFDHYFASMWNECNCEVVWTFLPLPFFRIGVITDLFQTCGHCWVFQICWHIGYSTLTASSVKIWNSSAGLPSPPLSLYWCFLRPTWLCTPGCLALGEWSYHHGYLDHEDLFFCIVLCVSTTSS